MRSSGVLNMAMRTLLTNISRWIASEDLKLSLFGNLGADGRYGHVRTRMTAKFAAISGSDICQPRASKNSVCLCVELFIARFGV